MKQERCKICKKKTGLVPFKCKCDDKAHFCALHRHNHQCTYDYHKDFKEKLIKENPTIVAKKVETY